MSSAWLERSPRLAKTSTDPSPKNAACPNGSSAPRFPDGHVLNDRWILKRRIGQGRYSDVYVAITKDSSGQERREVAIKVEKENIPSEGRLLKWEATVLTDIQDCPYVCRMHESGVLDDGGFYIVMDLCSETLSECRKRQIGGQFQPHKGAAAAMSMLNCIEALHRSGYVHRDIKPSNFVRPLKNAKNARRSLLIDFGLARRHHRNGVVLPARALGEFRGTSKYASLNSHSCKELGPRDDMYSFLYVLVDFVLGKLPWIDCRSRNEVAAMKRKIFGRDFVRNDFIPEPIYKIAQHLNTLRFQDNPDYALVRSAVSELCNRRASIQFIPPPPSDSPIKFIPDIIDEVSSPMKSAAICELPEVLSPLQAADEPVEAVSSLEPAVVSKPTEAVPLAKSEMKSFCETCLIKHICHDAKCSLLHPPYRKAFVFSGMNPLRLCIEFVRGKCQNDNCLLHHWTETEQSQYLSTGALPSRSLSGSPVPQVCMPMCMTPPRPVPTPPISPVHPVTVPSPEQIQRWRNNVIMQTLRNGLESDPSLNFAQATVSLSQSGPCEVSAETNTDEGEILCTAAATALEEAEKQTLADDLGDLTLSYQVAGDVPHSAQLNISYDDVGSKSETQRVDSRHRNESGPSSSGKSQLSNVVSSTANSRRTHGNRKAENDERSNDDIIPDRPVPSSSLIRLPVDRDGTCLNFEEVLMKSEEFKLLIKLNTERQNFEEVLKNAGFLPIAGKLNVLPQCEGESSSLNNGSQLQSETIISHESSGTRSAQETLRVKEGESLGRSTPPMIVRIPKRLAQTGARRIKGNRYKRHSSGPPRTRISLLDFESNVSDSTKTPELNDGSDSDFKPVQSASSEIKSTESTENMEERSMDDAESTCYCDPRITIRIKRIRRKISDVLDTVFVLRLKRSLLMLPKRALRPRMECFDFAPVLFNYLKESVYETPEIIIPDINNPAEGEASKMVMLEPRTTSNGSHDNNEKHSETESFDGDFDDQQQAPNPSPIAVNLDQPDVPARTLKRRSNEQIKRTPGRKRSLNGIAMNSDAGCKILSVSNFFSDPIVVKIKRDLISDFIARKRPKIK